MGRFSSVFHRHGKTFFEFFKAFLLPCDKAYDLIASKFNYTPFRTPDLILSSIAPHIGETETIGAALDICCGTGAGMQMLRPLCRDRLVGIDISQGLLDIARKQNSDKTNGVSLEYIHGNALEMTFDSEFDVAVCFGAMSHVTTKYQDKFLRAVARALRPGGRFLFVSYYRPKIWSLRYWYYRIFNMFFFLRNLFLRPPWIVGKLHYCLPKIKNLLEYHGFEVQIIDAFEGDLAWAKLVSARKK